MALLKLLVSEGDVFLLGVVLGVIFAVLFLRNKKNYANTEGIVDKAEVEGEKIEAEAEAIYQKVVSKFEKSIAVVEVPPAPALGPVGGVDPVALVPSGPITTVAPSAVATGGVGTGTDVSSVPASLGTIVAGQP